MFRDFYASKRLTQVSNNNTISVPSLTHRTHATRRENHPPFESPRFNQREKANEGSHLHSPRANTTPPLFLQQQQQTTATQNNNNNQTSSPSNVPVVVQNVEKAKSASRYGNEVLFSVSQPQYYCHQSTPKESPPCFHSRETVELRRKNEEQRERAANTFLLQQQQQQQQQRKKNEDYLQALAMRPMSPPEFTNGTGTVLTAEKRVAVAGTQTDENNEENETNARKARQSRRLAGLPPPVTSTGKREDEETIDELDISKRITSAVEKTLESVAKETRRGMEEIAMRTQRDVLRCAADVARMQRDLSEFMGRYGVKRKNSHRNDDDDDNEDDVVYFGHTSEREIDATKTASKKKQSTMMISGGKTPALVSMISDGKTPTNVVIAHIRENASIVELRAAHPLLFNGALSIRNHTASFLRKKISEGYVGYAAERERALAPTLPDKEKEELEMENNDIFTSRSKPKNKAVPIDDDDSDDENVELRVREEIEAFKRKTKARTARRRGFAVSTKLSIET